MKTLRNILESDDKCERLLIDDINSMAKKLGLNFEYKMPLIGGASLFSSSDHHERRVDRAEKERGDIIVTQFQIQFGLDEEF